MADQQPPQAGLGRLLPASAPGASGGTDAGAGIRVSDGNSLAWRRAQIPAPSGFGNARSMRYGMGFGIFDRSCGWGGWGGSLVMVDLDARMTVPYVMNQMLDQGAGGYRGLGIVMAAYEGLS